MSNSFSVFPTDLNHPFYSFVHCGIETSPEQYEEYEKSVIALVGTEKDYSVLQNPEIKQKMERIIIDVFKKHSKIYDYQEILDKDHIAGGAADRRLYEIACDRINHLFRNNNLTTLKDWASVASSAEIGKLADAVNRLFLQDYDEYRRLPSTKRDVLGENYDYMMIPLRQGFPKAMLIEDVAKWFEAEAEKDETVVKDCSDVKKIAAHLKTEENPNKRKILLNLFRSICCKYQHVFPSIKDLPRLQKEWEAKLTEMLRDKRDPVDIAAFVHMGIVCRHPYVEANGRTARTMMNIFLRLGGHDVVYFPSDKAYTVAVEVSSKDYQPFAQLIRERLAELKKG